MKTRFCMLVANRELKWFVVYVGNVCLLPVDMLIKPLVTFPVNPGQPNNWRIHFLVILVPLVGAVTIRLFWRLEKFDKRPGVTFFGRKVTAITLVHIVRRD